MSFAYAFARRVVRAGLLIRIRVTAAPRGMPAGRMPTGHSLAMLADVAFCHAP